jgi:hypothetical protein
MLSAPPPVLMAWRVRGPLVGGIALLVFTVFGVSALAPRRIRRWSRRHAILDGSLLVPATVLGLVLITRLSLWLCLVVAIVTRVVTVPLALRSRRSGAK